MIGYYLTSQNEDKKKKKRCEAACNLVVERGVVVGAIRTPVTCFATTPCYCNYVTQRWYGWIGNRRGDDQHHNIARGSHAHKTLKYNGLVRAIRTDNSGTLWASRLHNEHFPMLFASAAQPAGDTSGQAI